MKQFLNLFAGLFFAVILAGCFGEDYDVGVPTAYLAIELKEVQLAAANIEWDTQSEQTQEKVENVYQFGRSQNEIIVAANQDAGIDVAENEKMVERFG